MSKNEEKEDKSAKGQKNNKLTKVNKKRENDNKRPVEEEGRKPDDISKNFPNFSILSKEERLAFFQALTTARKNVEKRGVPTRIRFGTVHDEYLKYFDQDAKVSTQFRSNRKQKRRRKKSQQISNTKRNPLFSQDEEAFENLEETSSIKRNLAFEDDHKSDESNISNQSGKKFPKVESRSPPRRRSRPRESPRESSILRTKEAESWDQYESLIQQDTSKMVDLYLRKKKRNERSVDDSRLKLKNLDQSPKSKTVQAHKKKTNNLEKQKKENARTCLRAKTTPQDTPRFDALNKEEREVFFKILQEAHDNVIQRNPSKKKNILPVNAIKKRYRGDCQTTTVFAATQEPYKERGKPRNLKVKVTLTSKDNERLSKIKSQILSDAEKEVRKRRPKSAESLNGEDFHKEQDNKDKVQDKDEDYYNEGEFDEELSIDSTQKPSQDSLQTAVEKKATTAETQSQKGTGKQIESNAEKKLPTTTQGTETQVKKSEDIIQSKTPSSESLNDERPFQTNKTDSLKTVKNRKWNKIKEEIKKGMAEVNKEDKKKRKKLKELEEGLDAVELINYTLKEKPEERKILEKEQDKLVTDRDRDMMDRESSTEKCEKELEIGNQVAETRDARESDHKDECESQRSSIVFEISNKSSQENLLKDEKRAKTIMKVDQYEQSTNAMNLNEDTVLALEQKGETRNTVATKAESLDSGLSRPISKSVLELRLKASSMTALKSFSLSDCCDYAIKSRSESELNNEKGRAVIKESAKEITVGASTLQGVFQGMSLARGKSEEEEKTSEATSVLTHGKVMVVDDNVIEKIKKLIYYLDAKAQKDSYSEEKEYMQLLVDYVDYLSKVLESLASRKNQNFQQFQNTYTAAEVHLKFDDNQEKNQLNQRKESKSERGKDEFIPRSVSEQDFRKRHPLFRESKQEKPKEKEDMVRPVLSDSESESSESEEAVCFPSQYESRKKILSTNIRLLQDLLRERAEFVEGSITDYKIVHHPEKNYEPTEKPPKVQLLKDEDDENMHQENKMKFFKSLLKCCSFGKKKHEEEGVFENLKGEAVRVDVSEEKKKNAVSATLNQSTMEVLKAVERKKIIEKYYKKE